MAGKEPEIISAEAPAGWEGDRAWGKLFVEHSILQDSLEEWRPRLSKLNQKIHLAPVKEFAIAINKCLDATGSSSKGGLSKKRIAVIQVLLDWVSARHYEAANRSEGNRRSRSEYVQDQVKDLEITRSTLIRFFARHDIFPKTARRHLLACLKEEVRLAREAEARWKAHFHGGQPLTGRSDMISQLFQILSDGGQSKTAIDAAIDELLSTCLNISGSGQYSGHGIRTARNRKPRRKT